MVVILDKEMTEELEEEASCLICLLLDYKDYDVRVVNNILYFLFFFHFHLIPLLFRVRV